MSSDSNLIKKGIVTILTANVINMVVSILSNLILPKYLSISTYADLKTFQLCLSYIGALHLGFNDGVYLEYGGKRIDEIGREKLNRTATTIKVLEACFFFLALIVGIILGNMMLIYVSFIIIPYLIIAYYKYVFQACGEFSLYGKILNTVTISLFVVNVGLILLKINHSSYYIIAQILLYTVLWLVIEVYSKWVFKTSFHLADFSFVELCARIKQGFLLMLGNFASTFITSMDRWFIKVLMTSVEFAHYSFAVTLEGFLNLATTPISTTLYNFFCKEHSKETVSKVRKYMILLGSIIAGSAFVVKILIQWYLPKYIGSQHVVFFLFASQIYYIINKSVFTNLYKARRKQNSYFVKLFITLLCAFILNILCYMIIHVKEAFSVGTLLSSVIWFILVNKDFQEYRCTVKERLFLVSMVIALISMGLYMNPIIGFFMYFVLCVGLGHILLPNVFSELCKVLLGYMKKKK